MVFGSFIWTRNYDFIMKFCERSKDVWSMAFLIREAEEDKRIQGELSKRNKHMLLQNEHIEVKTVTLGRDCLTYKEAYKLIIEDLQKNGIVEG